MSMFPRYTAAHQLPHPVQCAPIVAEWKERIASQWWGLRSSSPERPTALAQNYSLIAHILTFGGEEVCMPANEPDLQQLLMNGQFLYGAGATQVPGKQSQCHANSASLWRRSPERYQIMTGYALSVDGMWRQHTWCLKVGSGQPVETTTPRLAYYGIVLSQDDAARFAETNIHV